MKKLDYLRIKNCAAKTLKEYQLTKLPIDPREVAEKADIIVQPKNDCSDGVSGMLLHTAGRFGILYATHLNNPGFENFSVAHELGHYFLAGHPEHIFDTDGQHKSHAGFISDNDYEKEADAFAASLLMPDDLFLDTMTEFEKGFNGIESMAKVCNTSLTATAIKYAELCPAKIIVIISTDGKVDFCCVSNSVFELKDIEIPKRGNRILKGTATDALAKEHKRVLHGDRLYSETDFIEWIESKKSKSASEEAIGLGKYGKILTVIS
jgi:Zn-dependent peptidase ImmA (M78 family)